MSFIDQWRAQLNDSLIECAKLVPAAPDIDLKYELLVVGILWPIRQPIQDFDLEAMQAVQDIVGEQAKYLLRMVQQWQDDRLATARNLAAQERYYELAVFPEDVNIPLGALEKLWAVTGHIWPIS
jgi:hypothetical protein